VSQRCEVKGRNCEEMRAISGNPSDDLPNQKKNQYTQLFINGKQGLYIHNGIKRRIRKLSDFIEEGNWNSLESKSGYENINGSLFQKIELVMWKILKCKKEVIEQILSLYLGLNYTKNFLNTFTIWLSWDWEQLIIDWPVIFKQIWGSCLFCAPRIFFSWLSSKFYHVRHFKYWLEIIFFIFFCAFCGNPGSKVAIGVRV